MHTSELILNASLPRRIEAFSVSQRDVVQGD